MVLRPMRTQSSFLCNNLRRVAWQPDWFSRTTASRNGLSSALGMIARLGAELEQLSLTRVMSTWPACNRF